MANEALNTVELSTIDTALAMAGVLTVRQYFNNTDDSAEAAIRSLAEAIYERVDWPFMLEAHTNQFYLAWKPNEERTGDPFQIPDGTGEGQYSGTPGQPATLDFYTDEAVLVSLLAIASPTHPVSPSVFFATRREGTPFVKTYPGALFTYQFGSVWLDTAALGPDAHGMDYFADHHGLPVRTTRQDAVKSCGPSDLARRRRCNASGLSATEGPFYAYFAEAAPTAALAAGGECIGDLTGLYYHPVVSWLGQAGVLPLLWLLLLAILAFSARPVAAWWPFASVYGGLRKVVLIERNTQAYMRATGFPELINVADIEPVHVVLGQIGSQFRHVSRKVKEYGTLENVLLSGGQRWKVDHSGNWMFLAQGRVRLQVAGFFGRPRRSYINIERGAFPKILVAQKYDDLPIASESQFREIEASIIVQNPGSLAGDQIIPRGAPQAERYYSVRGSNYQGDYFQTIAPIIAAALLLLISVVLFKYGVNHRRVDSDLVAVIVILLGFALCCCGFFLLLDPICALHGIRSILGIDDGRRARCASSPPAIQVQSLYGPTAAVGAVGEGPSFAMKNLVLWGMPKTSS